MYGALELIDTCLVSLVRQQTAILEHGPDSTHGKCKFAQAQMQLSNLPCTAHPQQLHAQALAINFNFAPVIQGLQSKTRQLLEGCCGADASQSAQTHEARAA